MAFALAAGIGGATSLISGLLGSNASEKASKEQQQSDLNNLEFQVNLLGLNQDNLKPFVTAGQSASSTLSSLLNPGTAQSTLQSLPGFQFSSKWGTKTAENALSAEGLGGSTGPLAQAISNYNNGLASTQYFNYVNALQGNVNSGISAGEGITGATNAASSAGGNALTSQGNAAASGTLGSANSLSNAASSAGSSASNSLILSSILGNSSGGGTGGINGTLSGLMNSNFMNY